MKNPQTTIAPTFLTHIISTIDGVHCTYVLVFRAQDHPCSIVIKPTKGDFLHDYQNRNNLHIGLTNSKGFVVEYDSQGLHRFDTCALIALCKCKIYIWSLY